MTAVVDLPLSLEEFEFDIPCEWDEYPCDRDAAVMCKGCADEHPVAICMDHYVELLQWFASKMPAICVCGRPLMHFHTHYDIVVL